MLKPNTSHMKPRTTVVASGIGGHMNRINAASNNPNNPYHRKFKSSIDQVQVVKQNFTCGFLNAATHSLAQCQ